MTWAEADTAVQELAHGFLALGVRRGERVAILCGTRVEWSLLDFALASIGAVSVPIYPSSPFVITFANPSLAAVNVQGGLQVIIVPCTMNLPPSLVKALGQ